MRWKNAKEYFAKERELIGSSTVDFNGPVITGGKGVWGYGLDGKAFLDFTGQVGLLNTGYCPSEVVIAIQRQAEKLHACMAADWPYCVEIKINGEMKEISRVALAERLIALTDKAMPFKKRIYFEVSGATAINLAVKIAKINYLMGAFRTKAINPILELDIFIPSKIIAQRFSFLVFKKAFHGRHGEAQLLSNSKPEHFWGVSSNCAVGRLSFPVPGSSAKNIIKRLEQIVDELRAHGPILAFIFEPVQGEGGINIPDAKTLNEIVEIISSEEIPVIADEIQTGFGRTGKMFACEHFSIQPDMIVLSKSLGAGLAISAVIVNDEKFPNLEQGMHSGSHCADPLACAAAIANIDKIEEENLVEQSCNHGAYLMGRLKEIARSYKKIVDVRGLGLMVGVELDSVESRDAVIKYCGKNGLLLAPAGEKTIRMTPALIITIPQVDLAMDIFSASLINIK